MTTDSVRRPDGGLDDGAVAGTANLGSNPDVDDLPGDADPAVALYECGFSIATIAAATGRGSKAVRTVLVRAGVAIRPGKAAPTVAGSAVAALPPGEAADIAHRIIAGERRSATARPWDPPSGPNAWRSVLLTALTRHRTVVLHEIVDAHLGRPPTRIEAEAAKRAAQRLADDQIARISVSTRVAGRQGQWLLHRATAPSVGAHALPQPRTIEPPVLRRQPIDPHAQVRNLRKRLVGLQAAAALDGPITAKQATQLDQALAEAATTLQQLRQRIKRLSR